MLFGAGASILKEQGPLMLSKLQHIQLVYWKFPSTNDPRDPAGSQKYQEI